MGISIVLNIKQFKLQRKTRDINRQLPLDVTKNWIKIRKKSKYTKRKRNNKFFFIKLKKKKKIQI